MRPRHIKRSRWHLTALSFVLLALAGCGTTQQLAASVPTARILLVTPVATSTTRPTLPPATVTTRPSLAASATPAPTIPPTATELPTPNFVIALPTPTVPSVAADGSFDANTIEAQSFVQINQLRAENGLPPLAPSPLLNASARAHSCDMAARHIIDHNSADGRTLAQRLPAVTPPWEWPSENIAAGFPDANAVVHAWFDESPPDDWHRRNILATEQRELGIGYCYSSNGGSGNEHFFTADFARRTDYYPLVLANGAPTISTPQVPFWLYGEGWADAVRFGAISDLSTTPWQPFASSGSYELAPVSGPQIVYAELRGPNGATETVSATVTLQ